MDLRHYPTYDPFHTEARAFERLRAWNEQRALVADENNAFFGMCVSAVAWLVASASRDCDVQALAADLAAKILSAPTAP